MSCKAFRMRPPQRESCLVSRNAGVPVLGASLLLILSVYALSFTQPSQSSSIALRTPCAYQQTITIDLVQGPMARSNNRIGGATATFKGSNGFCPICCATASPSLHGLLRRLHRLHRLLHRLGGGRSGGLHRLLRHRRIVRQRAARVSESTSPSAGLGARANARVQLLPVQVRAQLHKRRGGRRDGKRERERDKEREGYRGFGRGSMICRRCR